MSVTPIAPQPLDIDPGDAFDVLVWDNPAVCNYCLSRVRRNYPEYDAARDEYLYHYQNHLRWSVSPWSSADPSAQTGYDPAQSIKPITFCQCGRSNGRASSLDYSYAEMKDRLRRVIDRLEEVHLSPDEDEMYRVVESLKCEQQIGGSDTEILRQATERGLETG